jgi:hypothetical protein
LMYIMPQTEIRACNIQYTGSSHFFFTFLLG